jgi:hypothetical protein
MTGVMAALRSPADEYDGIEYAALPVSVVSSGRAMYFG